MDHRGHRVDLDSIVAREPMVHPRFLDRNPSYFGRPWSFHVRDLDGPGAPEERKVDGLGLAIGGVVVADQ
jgi:hypothetical protein